MTGRSTASAPGLPALRQALADLPDAAKAEVSDALDAVGADLVTDMRRRLGRTDPSAPGNPPADPAGPLAASLAVRRDGLQVTVTAASPRAPFLEYGTRTMTPRPFLRPAVAAVAERARARLRAALARAAGKLR